MEAKIESKRGFYIGDVCYVLADDIYHDVWGANGYRDGVVEARGFKFAVSGTAFGDGTYYDREGYEYGVDAGVIGLVPLELVEKDGADGGRVILGGGEATFEAEDGVFFVSLPNGDNVVIDTKNDEDEDDDDYFEDDVDECGYDPYLGCYTDDV